MSEEGFSSRAVDVHRVRRRASRIAAQTALGVIVLPVIAMLGIALAEAVAKRFMAGSAEPLRDLQRLLFFLVWPTSWLIAAPIAMITSAVLSVRRKLAVRELSVKDGTLRLHTTAETKEIPGHEIEGALVRASTSTDREAEIALKSGDALHVRVKDKGEGGLESLIASLGFGGAKRRTVIPLGGARSPLWSTLAAVVMGLVLAPIGTCVAAAAVPSGGFDGIATFMAIAFVIVTTATARLMTPRKVIVGADGVEVHGALRRRFFPRSRIFGVEKVSRDVLLILRDGDGVTDVRVSAEDDDRRGALAKCIRDALEDPSMGPDPRSALLARGKDAIGAWRERVKKLVGPNEGYRSTSLPVETLVRTIRDPDAPPDVRVGAAMAIASSRDDEAKEQLRIATDAIVDRDLRVALETAAEAEAEDLAIQEACARATRS